MPTMKNNQPRTVGWLLPYLNTFSDRSRPFCRASVDEKITGTFTLGVRYLASPCVNRDRLSDRVAFPYSVDGPTLVIIFNMSL